MQFSKLALILVFTTIASCIDQEKKIVSISDQDDYKELQIIVTSDSLILKPTTGLVYYQNKLFTGSSVSHYSNNSPAVLINYVKGKKHGINKKWFRNGDLSFLSTYKEGKKNGHTRTWWSNGNLRSESYYVDGVPDGIQRQWYSSGSIFKKINLQDGKENGLQQSWRENGKIYNNYEAKNGRIFGLKRTKLCYELEDENIRSND